jgi:hypothetical protein
MSVEGYHLGGIRFFSGFNVMNVSDLGISCKCKEFTPYGRIEPTMSTDKDVYTSRGKKLLLLLGPTKRLLASIFSTDVEKPNCDSTGFFWYI